MQSEDIWDHIKEIRKQTRRSWKNIWQAVCELQGLEHEPFGTAKVENSSKSCVRRILRETRLTLPQLAACLRQRGMSEVP